MARFLIHIHSGPEAPNKATLGLLVALTAQAEGHSVTLFLAADGVHLLAVDNADAEGQGTGRVGDHLSALKSASVRFCVSGMSSKARGYDAGLIAGYADGFSLPTDLVAEADAADTVLCY